MDVMRLDMEYIEAKAEDTERIYNLVQSTIKTIYPKYYPKKVVNFFCEHHKKENILADIEKGYVYILLCDNQLVGTGTRMENHITRVFVFPKLQGKGYGSYIMTQLESAILDKYDTAQIDASLAANILYEHRGYKTIRHEQIAVDDEVLVYEVMEKE